MVDLDIKRGEIFWVDLEPSIGSEIRKRRPCIIIQNDVGNRHSSTTIIAPFTSKMENKNLPVNVYVSKEESGLKEDGLILLGQIKVVDKLRLIKKVGYKLSKENMKIISDAIKISLAIE